MTQNKPQTFAPRSAAASIGLPGWDALLLAILVFAHLRILSFAEQVALPLRLQDVLRHPVLGNVLPADGIAAMGEIGPAPGEPIGLLLHALTLGLLLGYVLVDLARRSRWRIRVKWWLLSAILITALFLPTTKLILLRQGSGPASYSHDGGVIQTEATIQFLLAGKNPYVEEYVDTPMAEWGFSEYRTALYHYPYLPWTFLFSAPAYLLGEAVGLYDQRMLYLLLFVIALIAVRHLAVGSARRLALVAALGLNPIMATDIVFGQNDSFVLCWLIFSLVAWQAWRTHHAHADQSGPARLLPSHWTLAASVLLFGLACASKPTAWFFAPFYGILLVCDVPGLAQNGWRGLVRATPILLQRIWPALLVFGLLVLPYVLWDPYAFYDDVWRWSSGRGETGYQIWGWGASNFILGFGWVTDRFDQWPFWLAEIVVALPLLLWLMRRQIQANTLANACWHYGLLLFGFFYVSRFLNENYLGYILAFLAIGILAQPAPAALEGQASRAQTTE